MTLRRLVAVLTSIALLHLSMAVGEASCTARSTSHGAMPAPAAMANHPMPVTADGPAELAHSMARNDVPPCGGPFQPHCCEAIAGCGVAVAPDRVEQRLASSAPRAAAIHEPLHDAPASFVSAPEPPPPKA